MPYWILDAVLISEKMCASKGTHEGLQTSREIFDEPVLYWDDIDKIRRNTGTGRSSRLGLGSVMCCSSILFTKSTMRSPELLCCHCCHGTLTLTSMSRAVSIGYMFELFMFKNDLIASLVVVERGRFSSVRIKKWVRMDGDETFRAEKMWLDFSGWHIDARSKSSIACNVPSLTLPVLALPVVVRFLFHLFANTLNLRNPRSGNQNTIPVLKSTDYSISSRKIAYQFQSPRTCIFKLNWGSRSWEADELQCVWRTVSWSGCCTLRVQ